MNDFLTFRKMITPTIIQVLFWAGVAFVVISGLVSLARTPIQGVMTIFLGPIIVRIYCEVLIVLFRILETLQSINGKTAGGGSAPATVQPQEQSPTF